MAVKLILTLGSIFIPDLVSTKTCDGQNVHDSILMGFLSTVTAMSHVITGFVDTVTGMSWKTHDAPSHGRYVKKTHATTHNHAGPVWLRVGNITLKDEEKSILYLTNAWLNGCIPKIGIT